MARHKERSPNALARGPARTDDIERARHDVAAAEPREARVQRKLDEVEATTASIRQEVSELRGAAVTDDRVRASRSTA
jgi:HAMP domain-containing protein